MEIITRASYSLASRRKMWEIVLCHLTDNGFGHGTFWKIMQNSLTSARKNGAKILDFTGQPLHIEAISRDDLFGFLGGTTNPTCGPQRRISDSKFAVLDAYFTLNNERLWVEFKKPFKSLDNFLDTFWRPSIFPDDHFFEQSQDTIWISNTSEIEKLIENEASSGAIKSLSISAITIDRFNSNSLFHITIAKFPIVKEFVKADSSIYNKIKMWSGSLDDNSRGIQIFRGYGCLCDSTTKELRVASVLRDGVTRVPLAIDLRMTTTYDIYGKRSFELSTLKDGETFFHLVSTARIWKMGDCRERAFLSDAFFDRLSQVVQRSEVGENGFE